MCADAQEMKIRHEVEIVEPCPGQAADTCPGRAEVCRYITAAQCTYIEYRRGRLPINRQRLAAQFRREIAVDLRPCTSVAHPNVKVSAVVGRAVVAKHPRTGDSKVVIGIRRIYFQIHDSIA